MSKNNAMKVALIHAGVSFILRELEGTLENNRSPGGKKKEENK